MTVTTRVRLMSCNFRLTPETPADIAAGHTWAVRRQPTIDILKAINPSVICGQECSTTIRNDLAKALGPGWRFIRNGNVIVWYDTIRQTLVSSSTAMLRAPFKPDGSTDPRRLVLVELKSKLTGDKWWAASTHLTAGEPDWQIKQMTAAVAYIKAAGDPANTIFAGDFNAGSTETDGPRKIAREAGLKDLRSRLAAPEITNVTSNTFNSWKPFKHDSWWIDDILTGRNFMPYWGRVIDTLGASDHQFLVASSIQL
jgi:endonuclease/exonuclease/phosphatase family metal-dependent hydrolase